MNSEPLFTHRPAGIGHPYATSPDQRDPYLPVAGQGVRLGVTAQSKVISIRCTLRDSGLEKVEELTLSPVVGGHADAAALAGGDGHLAAAQSEQYSSEGCWSVDLPVAQLGHEYSYRFTAVTVDGTREESSWFNFAPAAWQPIGGTLTFNGQETHAQLVEDSVAWLVNTDGIHRVRFGLKLRENDHALGFGERFDALDQRGKSLDAVVFEQYKSQGEHGRTYMPMPFAHVISDQEDELGWGFHLRTSRRTWFDVGTSAPEILMVEAQVENCEIPQLDVAIHDGNPREVLDEFLSEVGRAEVLPDWIFHLWASGNEWNTQSLVEARMQEHRDHAIPVGAVVIEAWSDEEGITIFRDAQYGVTEDGRAHQASDFSYRPDGAWPDPKALIADLHSQGVKVLLWQIPLQKTHFDLGDSIAESAQVIVDGKALVEQGHAIREADGSAYHNRGWWFPQALMPDLSSADARSWWTEKRRYLVRDLDVDGFKTDGGEHAWGDELVYSNGKRGDEANNLNGVYYAKAFGDLLRSEGKAPVTFSRAGFTGSQAHGIFWAGDENSTWQAFESSILAGVSASACGIVYWGWDLAGFSGPVPDAELYIRSAAASVFMPIMQYHSEFNHHQLPLRDRTPWNVAALTGDTEVVADFRHLVNIRERLVSYLSEQARNSVNTASPLMRALCFDFPNDSRIWHHPRQFQLGDALLISPVTAPNTRTWSTYLPALENGERWVDVWSSEYLEGGNIVEREVPRTIVPVYCRESSWATLSSVFS